MTSNPDHNSVTENAMPQRNPGHESNPERIRDYMGMAKAKLTNMVKYANDVRAQVEKDAASIERMRIKAHNDLARYTGEPMLDMPDNPERTIKATLGESEIGTADKLTDDDLLPIDDLPANPERSVDKELKDKVAAIVGRFQDYVECEEWHIHTKSKSLRLEPNNEDLNNHREYDEEEAANDLMQLIKSHTQQMVLEELRNLRLGKFTNHLFQHSEYCVPTKDIDKRIAELESQLKSKEGTE